MQGTILVEFTVPSVWPLSEAIAIFNAQMDGDTIQVTGEPAARLRFVVQTTSGVANLITPPLVLTDYAFLKIAFAWDGTASPVIAINGVLLSDADHDSSDPVLIVAKSTPPTGFRNKIIIDVPPAASAKDSRFLGSIADLQMRLKSGTLNDLLDASGILRRLFTDGSPLANLVKRSHRVRLRFTVADDKHCPVALAAGPVFTFSNPSPDFADESQLTKLNFDQFLAYPLLHNGTRSFSVRDVICVCANAKGGIHFDEENPKFKELLDVDSRFLPFLMDASLAALPGLAWSAINGLRPLIQAVQSKYVSEVGRV